MRRAFTLVELLVVIAIIAILSGVLLGALWLSQESARTASTQSTIAAIDTLISERYDSYRTRRVQISMGYDNAGNPIAETLQQFAARRLAAMRELIRTEMPDRWSDVTDSLVVLPARGSLSRSYLARYTAAPAASIEEQEAECLYLILESMREDDAANLIMKRRGDTDGDGLYEILDGWGRPIRWIRWPSGFVSDLQTGNAANDHDPFDPLKNHPVAYRTHPLVYSAGPNKDFDVLSEFNPVLHYSTTWGGWTSNPYVTDSASRMIGLIVDTNGNGLGHMDNITNHQPLDARR